jgi:hypothetical protein
MKRTSVIQRLATAGLVSAVVLGSVSCGEVSRTGRSPAYVIIDNMEASAGGEEQFAGFLLSDVFTSGGVINDSGRASLRLALRNPGTPTAPLGPTTLNEVTLSRYRVRFIRADGRNTPGVDVPFGFDGGVTVTVPASGTAEVVFDLVRHQNKREPPLSNLRGAGAARFISTLAEVSFYGRDQAGNDVEVTGTIQVNFGDYADPDA